MNMTVKELIEKLQEYDQDAHIEINFEYCDSDEGVCYDSFTSIKFTTSESNGHKFLTLEDGGWE